MHKIRIINKIEQKVNEYHHLTGVSKKRIAENAGVSSSRMYQIFKTSDMMISVYAKFMVSLQCSLTDLVEFEITGEDE